ncbi:MAG TPA: neutral/alkaline non-lysosomal ceramidase N-terminal domain-containing protein [bacterium]|nr:neutral/alkaline non-lysosomal ceramidase N-terminal domain-containing protein [bacterium]
MEELLCGISKVDITPPVGYYLQGHSGRNKPSKKVHDPLYLKLVCLSDKKTTLYILSSDLIGFSEEFVHNTREELKNKLKISPENFLFTSSHTHTGPFIESTYGGKDKVDPDYLKILQKKIVGAAIESRGNMEKVNVRVGKGKVNIGIVNRRKKTKKGVYMMPNFEGPIDEDVSVIKFEKKDGTSKVILFNYTCHPTTLSTKIYEISADYPGVAQREIEKSYSGCLAMFTNGCCGDVRPALVENGQFIGGNFEDIERMGKILFGEVIKVSEKSISLKEVKLNSKIVNFKFQLEDKLIPKNIKHLEEIVQSYKKQFSYFGPDIIEEWKEDMRGRIEKGEKLNNYIEGYLQFIKIGDIFILGLPGEIMVEIGIKLKEKIGKNLIIFGYSNGLIGYVPTANGIKEGGYEAGSFLYHKYPAPYSEKMESDLINEVINQFKKF